ncbi:MAG TPA: hypothetical protein VJ547_11905 [Candidatus Thermoplasmatota archaeon]|nr:hypothetical protein [Candidatus Thermoplasmatota archaeon]
MRVERRWNIDPDPDVEYRVHSDGYGFTTRTPFGYTAYRIVALRRAWYTGGELYIVKERHQRHGATRRFFTPVAVWEDVMAEVFGAEV